MRKMIKGIGEDRKELGVAYSTLLYLMVHDAILLQEAFGRPTEIQYADVYNNDTILAVLKFGEDIRCVYEAGCSLNAGIGMSGLRFSQTRNEFLFNSPSPISKMLRPWSKINEQDSNDPKANVIRPLRLL